MKLSFARAFCALALLFASAYFLGTAAAWCFSTMKDSRPAAAAPSSWGLSFPQEGRPPIGNATCQELAQYQAYYMDDSGDKILYLTFDAGYENGCTPSILDTLKKHQVPAAFFVVGNYISSSPDLVRRMVQEGHIVANHTYSHPDMSQIASEESFRRELESLEQLYQETTGQTMAKYYRPPQGKYSLSNLKMAQDLGYTTFFWSLAYVDWLQDDQPSPQEALKKLLGRIHPGAILLLHSTSTTNAQILDELLTRYKEMGYTFGTLDQLTSSDRTAPSLP